MKRRHPRMPVRKAAPPQAALYQIEVLGGLEPFARAELKERLRRGALKLHVEERAGEIDFAYSGRPADLLDLRLAVAAYSVRHFKIPRPKALLGDVHFKELARQIRSALKLSGSPFGSFRFGAAGANSAVFKRLAERLAEELGLAHDPEDGDLLLRFRPGPREGEWAVLARLTPRPLATRAWRVADMPGALNATIAALAVRLSEPSPEDRVLSAMCGSGSMLIERLLYCPAERAVGVDISEQHLRLAERNLEAAGISEAVLHCGDCSRGPLPPGQFDVVLTDLPWGERVGSRRSNLDLYRGFLEQAELCLAPGGRAVIITQDDRSFVAALERSTLEAERSLRVSQGGFRPHLYVLRNAGGATTALTTR